MESQDNEYAEYAAQNAEEYAEKNNGKAAEIRAWLKDQHIKVSDGGVIPRKYVIMFDAYHNTNVHSEPEFNEPEFTEFAGSAGTPESVTGLNLVVRRLYVSYMEIASLALQEAVLIVNRSTPSYLATVEPLGNDDMADAMDEVEKLVAISSMHLKTVHDRVKEAIENNAQMELGLRSFAQFLTDAMGNSLGLTEPGLREGGIHDCGNADCPVMGYENSEEGEKQYARDVHNGVKPQPSGSLLSFDENGDPTLEFAGPVFDRSESEEERYPF